MSRKPYPVPMEAWRTTPITRGINPLTGRIEGDDAGYRDMKTLKHNRSELVVPNVLIRASYDGIDEFGLDIERLPGGLVDGKLVLRATAAHGIELLDQLVFEASDGQFIIAALDGFRSEKRQAAGFTRLLKFQMGMSGVTAENHVEKLTDFMRASRFADGTFSWVRVRKDATYETLFGQLRSDSIFMQKLSDWLVADLGFGDIRDLRDQDYVAGMEEYLTVSANSGIGYGAELVLDVECNAHAGGGACDVFVIEAATGRPMNIVPFDYPGQEAGMDFMEGEGAYDKYLSAVREKLLLAKHLERLGFSDPATFTLHEWERIRDAIRILYHAAKGIGCTYYSSEHGGENWHLEPGNVIYEPSVGNVVAYESLTANLHPDAGNPGHTLQTHGRKAVAVWGGATAHSLARLNYGLQ